MSGFGVYIHWPFCISKCPYCDFNSHVRDEVDQSRWRAALIREIATWAERTGGGKADSVFFGGGTPSLMPPGTAGAVLDAIAGHFGLSADAEIALEANPSSVEAARFADFRAAGVNRVSLGVQSFDESALKFLGRAHDSAAALAAIETARRTFERFSFDMIYALPGQSAADWEAALRRALGLAEGHLSLYQLTIEPNTGFAGQVRRGVFQPLDDDPAADLWDLTQEITAAAGLPAYETSNHAAPGQESRHNLIYWRYGSWVGIGPGAHGRPVLSDGTRRATANRTKPESWLEAVETSGHALAEDRPLPPAEQGEEALMMGLRLAEGIDAARFRRNTGMALADIVDSDMAADLAGQGLVRADADGIALRPEGRLLLDTLAARLLADRTPA